MSDNRMLACQAWQRISTTGDAPRVMCGLMQFSALDERYGSAIGRPLGQLPE